MERGFVSVCIRNYRQTPDKVVFYVVKVTSAETSWTLEKRFSEFYSLYKELDRKFLGIPSPPGKTFFRSNSPEFLDSRKSQLEEFLQSLVCNKELYTCRDFLSFLEIPSHIPSLEPKQPNLVVEVKHSMPAYQLHYQSQNLVLCSRVTNMALKFAYNVKNLGFSNSEGEIISEALGQVTFLDIRNISAAEHLWDIGIGECLTCVHWEPLLTILAVGSESGRIYCFLVKTELGCSTYENYCLLHPHSGQINGIAMNYNNSYMYSCGEDKRLVVIQLKNQECVSEYLSSEKIDLMKTDIQRKRIYLGTRSGVEVLDITEPTPEVITKVESGSKLVGLCAEVGLIIQGRSDGFINVYQQGTGTKEKFCRVLHSFRVKTKLTSIDFSKTRREIYLGNNEGTVSVYDLRDGNLISSWKAHQESVLCLYWIQEEQVLVSSGNESYLKFWNLPEDWKIQISPLEETKQAPVDLSGWHK
mmetsp:Transcript_12059/g.17612  ORF Transcript_12059/g.17612 Transcript_12059/m.17612 type:complete len:471 (+) Transcript_12059:6-1418(+)